MKKLTYCILISLTVLLAYCKGSAAKSMAERITGNWIISTVREASTVVYQTGSASSIRPGYSGFTIELTSGGSVVFVDFDGVRFTGSWEIQNEKTLVLNGLSPAPTGTGGTINFTIDELTDGTLTLTRTAASKKTGDTVNKYVLTKK